MTDKSFPGDYRCGDLLILIRFPHIKSVVLFHSTPGILRFPGILSTQENSKLVTEMSPECILPFSYAYLTGFDLFGHDTFKCANCPCFSRIIYHT
ncbi:hypothetical protein CEXT_229271 [Caerostris extrusa]|uniref:Uncharacterized protein n=1 Tax=Caerostris extrusa TaxID=172846 RepID=A0AAV4NPM3_CAEEX|nr:hypothetical protein CEXT_229271 [Caerostris extrusa]